MTLFEKLNFAADFIRQKISFEPEIGIVLGTGIGALANDIEVDAEISYSEIPGFVTSTVEFHEGKLIIGKVSGKKVIAMQGRFHYYEGYSMEEIVFPVRVMKILGASKLIVSNAGGGINKSFDKGDLVLIKDYINLLGDNPLRGLNDPKIGPRFPDMSSVYSKELISITKKTAEEIGVTIKEGVYAAMTGPMLETPAEYRMLRIMGADLVGMSTVPETIAAVHMGMEVLGITIVSDPCDPDNLAPVNITEIVTTCEKAEPKLTLLVKKVLEKI